MRHLNRIIFINSAYIPYAEIRLDGNVHLEGTQGVGKSTVLRALLFFYNADKLHLGIQPGQKPFEEFYFRYSNSFIVYEVATDPAPYSIIAMRNQGKVVYRFVDAPFDKQWLFGDGTRAESDWIRIRDRILAKGIAVSAKVDTYEEYRDIIFGNTHDRSHRYDRYDRYAIVESSSYQNIPRSIQNVFLNSKLDADFVKRTIIQSMADKEEAIDLPPFRSLVQNFEKEFDEIDCWFHKDKNGIIPVRVKADRVIKDYRLLMALRSDVTQTWHCLNQAVSYSREQLPLVEDEMRAVNQKIHAIEERQKAEDDDYQKEHDKLIRDINTCDLRLKDIRDKRRHYADIHIDDLIALDSQRPQTEAERQQKQHTLEALEAKYISVADKYRSLAQALDDELQRYLLTQQEELQKQRTLMLNRQEQLQQERDKQRTAAEQRYHEWLHASDERMDTLRTDEARANMRLSELQYWHPKQTEMDNLEQERLALDTQEKDLTTKLSLLKSAMDTTRKEGQVRQDQLRGTYDLKIADCQKDIDRAREALGQTDDMLARYSGSLYEWLTKNKPGWEENIGKVVDEHNVLYANDLDPKFSQEDSSTLFGITLNLDAIEQHHRTPDDYRRLQQQQQQTLASLRQQLVDLQTELDDELKRSTANYNRRISELKQQETTLNLQLAQLPTKRKDLDTRLRLARQQEEEMIAEERKKRTETFSQATIALEKEHDSRTAARTRYEKAVKTIIRGCETQVKALRQELDNLTEKQKNEATAREADIDKRKEALNEQEHTELQGMGADTTAIDRCRQAISNLDKKLQTIEAQRHFIIEYRKDEEELFSHETEYRDTKRQLQARQDQAEQRFHDRQRKHREDLATERGHLSSLTKRRDTLAGGLADYDQMRQTENILTDTLLDDEHTEATTHSCRELVTELRGKINKLRNTEDQLKRDATAFNSHFLGNNTFHFLPLEKDEDYIPYAVNLQEFLDNNLIEVARKRTSEHYSTILRSVAREVGMLMSHKAEIRRVINDINNDFERNGGFSGVIHSIEMRMEESSDKMMQLMVSIRDFTEENSLSMGEANLFSGDDHDRVNMKVVGYLKQLMRQLNNEPSRTSLTLSDTFRLQFRVRENDNDTRWVERITNVGSDGTDVLVKAMVNIMLINVFKQRAARKSGDFVIHCMMDEIGKLHPSNVKGILQFANVRNIYLINCSPMGFNGDLYKYNYILRKDAKAQTHIYRLISNTAQ